MNSRIAIRGATLVAALTAIAATAWATHEPLTYSTWVPAPAVAPEPAPTDASPAITEGETVVVTEPLSSSERVMPLEAAALPGVEHATQPPIRIEERRLTQDERIQATVLDLIAQAPNLSGKIGVESHGAVVTLSGYTTTAGQARRAERYAASVEGVKSVQNEIRARVGGSV